MRQINLASRQSFVRPPPGAEGVHAELLRGLTAARKYLPAKYFYDERGSQLFDLICEQPEYYPTRTEIGILRACATEVADLIGRRCTLIELGGGATRKVRLLLDELRPQHYFGIDISRDFLLQALRDLSLDYPWLHVSPICADFTQAFELPALAGPPRLVFFPGSTIGNFEPAEAACFLRRIRGLLDDGDALLIGVDLKKDPQVLHRAYNDEAGITAEFNLNLLHRLRRELDADIDPERFEHRAFYNKALGRIEMHLVSHCEQAVEIRGTSIGFAHGESIHTENSYKYGVEEFRTMSRDAGFSDEKTWTDAENLFSVHYLACRGGKGTSADTRRM